MQIEPGKLLRGIHYPEDLKNLSKDQLVQICDELRQFIIDHVSVYGGHFGAGLGVVELTVALHYVLNTPDDQLIWDVGHQAYGHKILTGRRNDFHTNRLYKGLSGFPKRKESPFDSFGVGHSSTSISAALGMAMASKYKGDTKRQHVAVIGDGAMTGGMAFEAMNHAGVSDSNMVIILNDNCMSIDPNVGALKDYLTDITTSHTYNKVKDEVWHLLGKISKFGFSAQDVVSKVEGAIKSALLKQSNLFESLNLRYFGPVDGHDVNHLVEVLNDLKDIPGPKILHCITVKGKGYAPAEKDQTKWHAPGKFDKITGEIAKKIPTTPQAPKYQDVFGHTLVELAEKNDKIVGVTPAMPSGSSMNIMMKAFPDRSFDVGIAEQHAVTFSAGLATQGLVPFCNIYSTFMQRAYDQVIHDVCLMLSGAEHQAPYAIRYPRGQGVMPDWRKPLRKIPTGQGRIITEGKDLAILSIGHIGNYVLDNAEKFESLGLSIAHYDMRFVKPLDESLLHEVFGKFDKVITVEDGCLMGGFGSAVLEWMMDHDYQAKIKRLGIPDKVIEHGEQIELHHECGFDPSGILQTVKDMMNLNVEDKIKI